MRLFCAVGHTQYVLREIYLPWPAELYSIIHTWATECLICEKTQIFRLDCITTRSICHWPFALLNWQDCWTILSFPIGFGERPEVHNSQHIWEKLLTLSVCKRHLTVGKLYKLCVYVCCNAHIMKQGSGRGEEKPEGRQLCSHWWKLRLSLWSASLTHYFLSFSPYLLPESLLFCPHFLPPPYFLLSTLSTYSPSVSSYKFPSAFTPASICSTGKLSSSFCSSF